MKTAGRLLIALILAVPAISAATRLVHVHRDSPQTQTSTVSPSKIPVYVTNFELDVVPRPPGQKPAMPRADSSQPGAPTEPPDPAKQASHLVNLMATKLIATLQQAGYPAQRLGPGDGRPSSGVQIRGVFAEVDSQNRWRRAMIRTGQDTGAMQAMVAVANLSKPDQALYEIAHLPGNTNKPGAVITFSPYVPLQKYELNKDVNDDAVARVASRVVADLTALLGKNPAALPD